MASLMAEVEDPVIEARDLVRIYRSSTGMIRKRYKETLAVDHISFSVGRGELFGILGPNGSGKTTLLRCINGFLTPRQGSIAVDGTDIERMSRMELARRPHKGPPMLKLFMPKQQLLEKTTRLSFQRKMRIQSLTRRHSLTQLENRIFQRT